MKAVRLQPPRTPSGRLEQTRPNVHLLAEIVRPLAAASPRAVFVVLTNPFDAWTYVALRSACLPPSHVPGSGMWIDTDRLRSHLACWS